MANEFDRPHPLIVLHFEITDVGAAGPTDGVLSGGTKAGLVVPADYKFQAVYVDAKYNAARTGGTSTVKVTDDGTEIVGGPEAVIDATNTTAHQGKISGDPQKVAAGHIVGVSATGVGTFAPATADAAVVVIGYLLPA